MLQSAFYALKSLHRHSWRLRHMSGLVLPVPQSEATVMTCLQGPGAQHAAWFRELQCEAMLMAVHDNLYKMEEYAVHSSAEAYVGTLGKPPKPISACTMSANLYVLEDQCQTEKKQDHLALYWC